MNISRRRFAHIAGTMAVTQLPIRGAAPVTAQAIADRLQAALGGDWPATGPDGFKAGDPATPVKAIATTAMATMDVLKQAIQTGSNFIVTYEPTFFGRQEGPPAVAADDPVFQAKKQFIEKNGLVVFRLHDHWQSRKEGDMTTGLADALGWSRYRVKPDDVIYSVQPSTAEDLVAVIRAKLKLRGGLRAVGDRKATVRRVMLYPGVMTPALMWQRYTEADLMLTGEVREWENTHYAADIFTAGEKRALVTLGRVASEDPGMRACAAWLNNIITEVQTQWISAGDLYWRAS